MTVILQWAILIMLFASTALEFKISHIFSESIEYIDAYYILLVFSEFLEFN